MMNRAKMIEARTDKGDILGVYTVVPGKQFEVNLPSAIAEHPDEAQLLKACGLEYGRTRYIGEGCYAVVASEQVTLNTTGPCAACEGTNQDLAQCAGCNAYVCEEYCRTDIGGYKFCPSCAVCAVDGCDQPAIVACATCEKLTCGDHLRKDPLFTECRTCNPRPDYGTAKDVTTRRTLSVYRPCSILGRRCTARVFNVARVVLDFGGVHFAYGDKGELLGAVFSGESWELED